MDIRKTCSFHGYRHHSASLAGRFVHCCVLVGWIWVGIASQKHRLCNALWMSNRRENLGHQPPNRCIDESSLLPLKLTIFFSYLFLYSLSKLLFLLIERESGLENKSHCLEQQNRLVSGKLTPHFWVSYNFWWDWNVTSRKLLKPSIFFDWAHEKLPQSQHLN